MEPTPTPAEIAAEYFAALGEHDLDTALSMSHPDLVDDFVAVGELHGRGAVRDFFEEVFSAFPDFHLEVVEIVGDADRAFVQWRATGTFTGTPFQGVHATGRSIELRGCDALRFEAGKIRHNTVYYDGLGFARQIGLLPKQGSVGDKAMTAAFNAGVDVWTRVRQPAKTGAH